MFTFVKWVLLLIICPLLGMAQLQISHPMARLVVQRGNDGTGRIYLSGRLTSAVDRVEAQLTPVAAGQGTATDWQTVQTNPTNNLFLGYVAGTGGWYVLTVRSIVNNAVTAQATVQPVGIGEVFVTAGQSNARGLGIGDNDLGTNTDRVNAIDSINHYYPPGNVPLFSSGDPSPVPVYKALTARKRVFPMAESSWGWGELGDYIVNRYNVPVTFYVTGWDGSTVDNWASSANGIPTCNRYNCAGGKLAQPATLYQPKKCATVLSVYFRSQNGTLASGRSRIWRSIIRQYSQLYEQPDDSHSKVAAGFWRMEPSLDGRPRFV